MMQRVAANRPELFRHEEGKLRLLGIYGRLITVLSSVVMEKVFEENFDKKKVDDLFYLVGETQSYNATKWTVEKVGMRVKGNEARIFNETASHSQLTGHGRASILKFDMNRKIVLATLENNIFPLQYRNLFGKQKFPVDHYTRGLFGGICKYLFGEDIVTICEECPSMGKKRSLYRIVPRRGAVEKYGERVKAFIPHPDLNKRILSNISIKKLIV